MAGKTDWGRLRKQYVERLVMDMAEKAAAVLAIKAAHGMAGFFVATEMFE